MDLVFKRYASPFLLIDEMISNSSFIKFVLNLIDAKNEEQLYEVWLHKIFNKGFEEFKESVMNSVEVEEMSVEETINQSWDILNSFTPKKEGE